MRKQGVLVAVICTVLAVSASAQTPTATTSGGPTIDDLISLKRAGSPVISPDGTWVAYTIRETNWDDNTYETEIWLADTVSGSTRQLTNGAKSSTSPAWSPDGRRLAFVSDRAGKRQIYVIDPRGGEAERLTASEEGVGSFAWSPDGKLIAPSRACTARMYVRVSTLPRKPGSPTRQPRWGGSPA